MRSSKSCAILFSWLFVSQLSWGLVVVDTSKMPFDNNDLPPKLRAAVLARAQWREMHSYKVVVDAEKNKLEQEPVIEALGYVNLKGKIAAENLLSPYAQKWAYQMSPGYGPNCWHTSMASIFLGWAQGRRMPPKEFTCHLKESFEQIDRPSQWGDLIRLSSANEEVHGFTYLGVDSQDPKLSIVFTKNGRMQSRFLFMDLATVEESVYPGNEITFFRRVRAAADPKEDKSAPCYAEMLTDDSWGTEE